MEDDSFSVTPDDLNELAAAFTKVANEISDLEISLNGDSKQLIGEMSTVLNQSPEALQRFFARWHTSVDDLVSALNEVSTNLYSASVGYIDTENTITKSLRTHRSNTNLR